MKSLTKKSIEKEGRKSASLFGEMPVFTSTGQMSICEDLYSAEEIKIINEEIINHFAVEEPEENSAENVIKSAKVHIVPCMTVIERLNRFISFIQDSNRRMFGYDIYFGIPVETFNYNEYDVGDEYGWHFDAEVGTSSDIKLTAIVNLSTESYEGGKFLSTGAEEKQIEEWGVNKPGTAIVFNATRSHKVTPVTKGKRITLSYWALGPKWK